MLILEAHSAGLFNTNQMNTGELSQYLFYEKYVLIIFKMYDKNIKKAIKKQRFYIGSFINILF